MANFDSKVKSLTGVDITDGTIQTYLTDWLTDGAREVINSMPIPFLWTCASETTIVANTGLDIGTSKLLAVVGDTGELPAREVPAMLRYKAKTSGWIEEATSTDPAFYRNDGKVYLLPTTIAGKALHVSFPAVAYGDATISNFPDEYEYLVVLYGAGKSLQYLLNLKNTDTVIANKFTLNAVAPDTLAASTIDNTAIGAGAQISFGDTLTDYSLAAVSGLTTLSSFGDPGSLTMDSVPPDIPSTSAKSITLNGIAPTYPDISSDKPSLGSIVEYGSHTGVSINDSGLFNIAAVAPDVPGLPTIADATIGSTTVLSASGAPTYNVTLEAFSTFTGGLTITDPGALTINAVAPDSPSIPDFSITLSPASLPTYAVAPIAGAGDDMTDVAAGTLGNVANQLDVSTWWDVLGDIIESDEDVELATTQINKINSYIQAYNSSMQEQLSTFNAGIQRYQAEIAKELQKAQYEQQAKFASELQQYQINISLYQAEVNAEVQAYSQSLNEYQVELNIRAQTWAQEQAHKLQEATSEFNELNTVYQANVQTALQQAQIDSTKASQQASLDIQAQIQDYTLELQRYQSEIQVYSTEVNAEVQEYSNELNKYSTELGHDISVWRERQSHLVQKYQGDLSKYQSSIQDALNTFNKNNTLYQAEVQRDIQNAQLEDQEEARKLQQYSQELQSYQAEVNSEVQEYQSTLQKMVQEWRGRQEDILSEYQANMQDRLNVYNQGLVEYQSSLQVALENGRLKLQELTGDADNDLRAKIEKENQILQKHSLDVQTYAGEVNAEVQEYTQKLAAIGTDYGWLNDQYNKVKGDYERGMSIMMGGRLEEEKNEASNDRREYARA